MQPQKDIISEITGDWGKWQLRTALLIFFCKIPSSWFMACIIFTAPLPYDEQYFCKRPPEFELVNKSVWINQVHPPTIPNAYSRETHDYCNIYSNQFNSTTTNDVSSSILSNSLKSDDIIPCTNFEHDNGFVSLVTQFDLVCSRAVLVPTTQFFHLFGILTGGMLATKLLEFISPRRVMLIGMITQILCGFITGTANIFEIHVFFRYLSAVCCAQMFTAGHVIFQDITGGVYRTSVTCLYENFWSIGVIILPGIAYISPDWTNIYMFITFPTFGYILLWFIIPDSPRWLIRKGHVEETKKVLLQCVRINRHEYKLPSEADYRLNGLAAAMKKEPPPAGWMSLWKGKRSIFTMIALHISWPVYVTLYMGMLLNIKAFGRDYLTANTIIMGCFEIIGVLMAWYFILKTKRKWLWSGLFNVLAGIFANAGYLIPSDFPEIPTVILQMLTAAIAKAAVSCAQAVLFTCTGELVPPEKRKICVYSCVVWARLWLLCAPFIGFLAIFHQLLGLTVFGVLASIGGIATCCLTLSSKPKLTSTVLPLEPLALNLNGKDVDKTFHL